MYRRTNWVLQSINFWNPYKFPRSVNTWPHLFSCITWTDFILFVAYSAHESVNRNYRLFLTMYNKNNNNNIFPTITANMTKIIISPFKYWVNLKLGSILFSLFLIIWYFAIFMVSNTVPLTNFEYFRLHYLCFYICFADSLLLIHRLHIINHDIFLLK